MSDTTSERKMTSCAKITSEKEAGPRTAGNSLSPSTLLASTSTEPKELVSRMPQATNQTPSSDTWAYNYVAESQTCPLCFAPVADNDTREVRGVMLAAYTCGGVVEHRWNLSWVLEQVPA